MITVRSLLRTRTVVVLSAVVVLAVAAEILYPVARAYVRLKVLHTIARLSLYSAKNLDVALARRATEESAAFIAKEMPLAMAYADKYALFDAALSRVDPKLKGMYCEFGVYTGTTINYIASRTPELVHGFDSFEGLPADWRAGFGAGAFKMQGLPRVRPNVRLYKGWFKDSLPIFKSHHLEPMAFGHLDADLYASTKDVFDALSDRIMAGTVLQFDEFFNYPGWQEGESKAFFEFCRARQADVEYLGYVATDEQVAVRIKKVAQPSHVAH